MRSAHNVSDRCYPDEKIILHPFLKKFCSMSDLKSLRFKFCNEIEDTYRRLCDELAEMQLPDGETARLAQGLMRSRAESIKCLLSTEEMNEYLSLADEE